MLERSASKPKRRRGKLTEEELARRRAQRMQSEQQRREMFSDNPDRVMMFGEWCALNSFSGATGRPIKNGEMEGVKSPQFIEVSARRFGITVGENRRWQAARARGE
jgi:hypothetical protein